MNWNNIIQKEMKVVLETLQDAFDVLQIDFYLIGAVARDIWFAGSGQPTRITKDVDFADGKGLTTIRVSGLQEVFETGTETVVQATGKEFQVASLAAIVLLKLIAYDDRPEKRLKDARDIANIIENYFELQADLIYEQHNDIFGVDERALDQLLLEEIAAEALGREIKKIIKGNLDLLRRVQNILAGLLSEEERSSFVGEMVAETDRPVNELLPWLEKLAKSLK